MERALVIHRSEVGLGELRDALKSVVPCDLALTEEDALARLGRTDYSVVILDHPPPGRDVTAVVEALAAAAPEALIVVLTRSVDYARGLEERAPGKVFRFLGGPDQRWQLPGIVAEGLRLVKLEREQRELVKKLGGEYSKLTRREKLLDMVVRERTKELEVAYLQVKAANRQILLGLAEAIEAKDAYTKGHCGRVAAYSMALGRSCGLGEADFEALEYGAFLHDIGKIGVRDAVLLKPGPLEGDEWTHMRIHPVVGDTIAAQIDMLGPMRPAIRNHHERWDGTGYPDRMSGPQIPLAARIVCITDAFDAMITDRPYKRALPLDECYRLLQKGAGKQFDPDLVALFVENRIGAP